MSYMNFLVNLFMLIVSNKMPFGFTVNSTAKNVFLVGLPHFKYRI